MSKRHKKNIPKYDLIIFICLMVVLTGMTIGFASYTQLISMEGIATIKPNGILHFTKVELINSSSVDTTKKPTFTDTNINLNLYFDQKNEEDPYMAQYEITIQNDTFYDQSFDGFTYSPTIYNSKGQKVSSDSLSVTLGDIAIGDKIASGKSTTFTVTINFEPNSGGDYNVEGEAGVETEEMETAGSLTATLTGVTKGDLTGTNKRTHFTFSVINTHKTTQTFNLSVSNTSHYKLTTSSGSNLPSFTISAGETKDFDFYVERLDDAIFTTNEETTGITLISAEHERLSLGKVILMVDKTEYVDTTPPTISNITLTMVRSEIGNAEINWSGQDDVGITKYTIELYNNQNILQKTYTANDAYYSLEDLDNGTYYVKIYGHDAAGNTATTQEISTCSQNAGHCSRSPSVEMRWTFNVDTSGLKKATSSGSSTATIDKTYTARISASSLFGSRPSSLTITMGGKTLTASQYTYTDGNLSIPNVNGDITISGEGSGGCLIEGTLIMLSDGSLKPIENITYDDSILVWNYETGKTDTRKPIWIEKTKQTNVYQLNTFSDGSTLKTYGYHGVFNTDLNRFVSVDNPKEFHIGTNIYKLNNQQTLSKVTVTSIEFVNEITNYYHVVSTDFYNIFANNFLTTDGTTILSNLYGFKENLTWGDTRQQIINEPTNLYSYSDFQDIMSEDLFYGLRVPEGKYLETIGAMNKKQFIKYLKNNQLNPDMYLPPEQKD